MLYLILSYDNVKLLFFVQTLHLAMDDDMLKIDVEFTDVSPYDSSSAETFFSNVTTVCRYPWFHFMQKGELFALQNLVINSKAIQNKRFDNEKL